MKSPIPQKHPERLASPPDLLRPLGAAGEASGNNPPFGRGEGDGPDLQTRLIEGSPDCIKILDLDGRLLSINAGGMKALEICDLAPILGSLWTDFWQGQDRKSARDAVAAARNGGTGHFVGFFATVQSK